MLEPVLYICLVQSLFAGIVIVSKRPQQLADRYIGAWLFIIGIESALALVNINLIDRLPYKLPFLVVPLVYGPILLLYVRSLIREQVRFELQNLLHFIPFLVLLGLTFLFREDPERTRYLPLVKITLTDAGRIVINALLFISLTTYSVLVYILLTKHRKKIKERFSFKSGRITLNWLLFVSITVYVSYILTFLSASIQLFYISLPFDPKIFSFFGLTLISFAFSFYGYRQAAIYHQEAHMVPHIAIQPDQENQKYKKSGIEPGKLKKYARSIEEIMQTDQLFLNPELTLDDVSQALGISRHHLTQAFNTELKMSFYTYINSLRINAFLTLIEDTRYQHFTLLAIAYECGFNSKSTFNSVFKRIKGITPSQYLNTRKPS